MKRDLHIELVTNLTAHKAAIFSLGKSDSDSSFLSGGGEGMVIKWDMNDTEKATLLSKIDTRIFSLIHVPEFELLVIGNMDGGMHWVDLANRANIKNDPHHKRGVFSLIVVNENLYSAGGDGKLTKWGLEEKLPLETLHLTTSSLRCIDYNSHTGMLAVGSSDNAIYFLDPASLKVFHRIESAHDQSVFATKFSTSGKYLFSGGRDAHLRIWDIENSFSLIAEMPAHWYTVNSIAIHPEEPIFATASRDRSIKIWDAESFDLLKVIEAPKMEGHTASVNKLLWTNHSNFLISASDDRTIKIWKINLK